MRKGNTRKTRKITEQKDKITIFLSLDSDNMSKILKKFYLLSARKDPLNERVAILINNSIFRKLIKNTNVL